MKGIKVEIPIFGLIIIIAAIVIGFFVFRFFKEKKDREQAKADIKMQFVIDSIRIVNSLEQKRLNDSINILNEVIKQHDKKTALQAAKTLKAEKELAKLKESVIDVPNDTIYQITQEYLPGPDQKLEYPYSGNQIKEIYKEHLECIKQKEVILEYSVYAGELEVSIRQRDEQIANYYDLIKSHEKELENETALNLMLQNQNDQHDQLKKSKNFWMIATPTAGIVGAVIGVLIVL